MRLQPVEKRDPVQQLEPDFTGPRSRDDVPRSFDRVERLLEVALLERVLLALPAGALQRFGRGFSLVMDDAVEDGDKVVAENVAYSLRRLAAIGCGVAIAVDDAVWRRVMFGSLLSVT